MRYRLERDEVPRLARAADQAILDLRACVSELEDDSDPRMANVGELITGHEQATLTATLVTLRAIRDRHTPDPDRSPTP